MLANSQAFNINLDEPLQFSMGIGSAQYTAIAYYNFFISATYLKVFDAGGALIMDRPLVGSPADYDIPLNYGTSLAGKIVYRPAANQIEFE